MSQWAKPPIKTLDQLPLDTQHAMLKMLNNALLTIVRLAPGGTLTLPVAEVDQAGLYRLTMESDQANRAFIFKVERKK